MRPNLYRTTDTHVYFLSGVWSQWTNSPFRGRLERGGELYAFTHAEQYMMAAKAHLFGDFEVLRTILASQDPKEQKDLGRSVRGYDDTRWRVAGDDAVVRGNLYKFSQNPDLAEVLVATGTRTLVEGNPRDRIWGVGLSWDDPRIEDPRNWRGENRLGKALEFVRPIIAELRGRADLRVDPWSRRLVPAAASTTMRARAR
jgi:ribA/ribD-fused uncharacterized protein